MAPAVAKNEYVERDDFVAGLDVERHQRQKKRVGTRRHRHGMRDADEGRDLLLERR